VNNKKREWKKLVLKIALAIFLNAHGLVHAILAIAPGANPGTFFTAVQWIGIIFTASSAPGLLNRIHSLGLPLLLVEQIEYVSPISSPLTRLSKSQQQ